MLALPRARVPIVKFEHPTFGIKCDIAINNALVIFLSPNPAVFDDDNAGWVLATRGFCPHMPRLPHICIAFVISTYHPD